MSHLELSRIIDQNKLYSKWDAQNNCSIFDEDKVVDYKQEAKTLGEMFIEELQPFGERGHHKI